MVTAFYFYTIVQFAFVKKYWAFLKFWSQLLFKFKQLNIQFSIPDGHEVSIQFSIQLTYQIKLANKNFKTLGIFKNMLWYPMDNQIKLGNHTSHHYSHNYYYLM